MIKYNKIILRGYKLKFILFLFTTVILFGLDATLQIEKDVEDRTHIAIVEEASAIHNNKVYDILKSDLSISGHFLVYDNLINESFDTPVISPELKNQEYVLKYKYDETYGAKFVVRLLKAKDSKEVFKKSYTIKNKAKVPFLIHKAVYDINGLLRYPDIDWINRYVIFSRYTTPRHSEIIISDYTFNYKKVVIRGGLNLFPKWADRKQSSFYYTSFNGLYPTLYKLNIYTGSKSKIISSEGMLVCSDVSSHSSKILVTMTQNGQPDIYEVDTISKNKQRITKFNGIDVNGKYVDNENSIVFVSNRLGYANVFKKSIRSNGVKQIVYHGRNNNSVDSYQKKIVYSSRESSNAFGSNNFNIYLSDSEGYKTRAITTNGSNQFPRFNANGTVVQYIKYTKGTSYVGYSNIKSHKSLLFKLGIRKIQAIDW
jgi:TolB protein